MMNAPRYLLILVSMLTVGVVPLWADDDDNDGRRPPTSTSAGPTGNDLRSPARSYSYDQGLPGYDDRGDENWREAERAYAPSGRQQGRGRAYSPRPVAPPGYFYSRTRGITPPFLESVIVAGDNTFLGVINRKVSDPDSLSNQRGPFGDRRSPYSIWNFHNGRWGSKYGPDSPWDPNATRPPKVWYGGYFWGYLSTNRCLSPRINPYWLAEHLSLNPW